MADVPDLDIFDQAEQEWTILRLSNLVAAQQRAILAVCDAYDKGVLSDRIINNLRAYAGEDPDEEVASSQ